MCERVDGTADAVETPIGLMPVEGGLDLTGLDIAPEEFAELMKVDVEQWREELPLVEEFFDKFSDKLPERMRIQFTNLAERLA